MEVFYYFHDLSNLNCLKLAHFILKMATNAQNVSYENFVKGVFINTLVGGGGWAIEHFCRQTFLTPPSQAAKTF